MACPSSYPITLANVRAEFGGAVGTSLGSYVRGGSYVPNTPVNSGVPTSKPITLGDLLGASASVYGATLSPTSLYGVRTDRRSGTVTTPGSCTVTVTGSSGTRSYLWTRVSGATQINAVSSYSATTKFNAVVSGGDYFVAVFKCTVTDSVLGTTETNYVTVTLEHAI